MLGVPRASQYTFAPCENSIGRPRRRRASPPQSHGVRQQSGSRRAGDRQKWQHHRLSRRHRWIGQILHATACRRHLSLRRARAEGAGAESLFSRALRRPAARRDDDEHRRRSRDAGRSAGRKERSGSGPRISCPAEPAANGSGDGEHVISKWRWISECTRAVWSERILCAFESNSDDSSGHDSPTGIDANRGPTGSRRADDSASHRDEPNAGQHVGPSGSVRRASRHPTSAHDRRQTIYLGGHNSGQHRRSLGFGQASAIRQSAVCQPGNAGQTSVTDRISDAIQPPVASREARVISSSAADGGSRRSGSRSRNRCSAT